MSIEKSKYPCRCEIVDADNKEVLPGIIGRTPEISRPHIGKRGLADVDANGRIKIVLDDGNIIYGDQCWWIKEP